MDQTRWIRRVIILISVCACGCGDDAAVQFARESAERQAKQSEQMAKLQTEFAQGAKEMVARSTELQRDVTQLQQDLRKDQAGIFDQRDALEQERRELAAARIRDPIIANALLIAGTAVVALAPLVLAAYALRVVETSRDDGLVTQVLIEDLTSDIPRLLAPAAPNLNSPPAATSPDTTDS